MPTPVRLILLSCLMLFVELALIRWAGSNVVYLSYFSNFVLLGSFLGIGVGFLRARSRTNLFPWAPFALALLVAFVMMFPVEIDRSGRDLIYFGRFDRSGLPAWITLPVIFGAVAAVMTMIAEGVARTFVKFEPLEAYRLDILGSIAGITAFSLLSFLHAPPVAWGVIAAILFLMLLPMGAFRPVQIALVSGLVAMLAFESFDPNDSWSPYYKVTTEDPQTVNDEQYWRVNVNGIPHQTVESIALRRASEPIYFRPYEWLRDGHPLDNVLIVGAGNGTDVAIALANGAKHVDGVEIDPRLAEIGYDLQPDRPYHDPRVDLHINDGRAFLEQTDRQYDLILFALPDSLTLVSGQSALRLESYLFTIEAMREAREHLAPGGAFGMYNFYREDWLVDRLARTLSETYGQPPCVDSVIGIGGLALMMASDDTSALTCPTRWESLTGQPPAPVDDDRPFLYLRTHSIPTFYLGAIALILIASIALIRVASGPLRAMSPYVDLFFMGAAFLLLETKNVVQFALLFGTTWFVNALVFAGILLSVVAAVEVAKRVRFKRPTLLYALLLVALAGAWLVPSSVLLELPFAARFAAAVVVAFTPIFLANLVFAERFEKVGASTVAFGANLLGAMVGGILEYTALITGYRALLIVAAALYGLAFLTGRRHLTAAA